MGIFQKKKTGGLADVIRCDEPEYLIWKWHPSGVAAGEGTRETAIRYGSALRVKDGEVAVFVYKQRGGVMQDYIIGPYDEKIKTKNFPVLSSIIGLAYEGDTPFQAEVYFINLATVIQVKFAVPFFDIYDPRHPDFGVPCAVRGTVSFKIDDYREFIKAHRLVDFGLAEFQLQIRDAVVKHVKSAVGNAPADANIPVVQIERRILEISDLIQGRLDERLQNDFAVKLTGLDIAAIEIDKSSPDYQELLAITKDVAAATVRGQTEANLEHYAESLRIQREEGQYAQHMQTRTANIGAYQVEQQTAVGVAAADALGQMGSNGAGTMPGGGSAGGFDAAGFMTSMALGGVVAQNMVGAMNAAMPNASQQQQGAGTPPPVPPAVAFHIAVNGQANGPFDIAALRQMAANGQFSASTLVWRAGMAEWTRADAVAELQGLFPPTPPPVPEG